MFQIASLKAALARKDGESQHSLSGSSEKYRTLASESSPYHANQRGIVSDRLGCRQPMVDVGNIEVLCILHFFCFDQNSNFLYSARIDLYVGKKQSPCKY